MRATRRHSLLALALAASLLAGCFSVSANQRPAPEAARDARLGGVSLRVFDDDAARRAGVVAGAGLVTELERHEQGGWTPVFSSLDPAWTVMGLEPGRYRVRFPARLDDAGNAVENAERPRGIRVRAGKVTEVEATLEHVSAPLIAAGVVTAVVATVLLHDWLDDLDLPVPPLPPTEVLETAFWIGLDIAAEASAPDWQVVPVPPETPVVTSHFPADGALVAAARVRVVFALSRPIGDSILRGDDPITVVAEAAGPIPGFTSLDRGGAWLVWESEDDLPRGDRFHVTLAAEDLRSGRPAEFSFRTTP